MNSKVLLEIGWRSVELGDIDEALETARDNLRWNPEARGPRAQIGVAGEIRGKFAEAHRWYKAEEARTPDDWLARNLLFHTYLSCGMDDIARRYAGDWDQQAALDIATGDRDAAIELVRANAEGARSASLAYALGLRDIAYTLLRTAYARYDPDILPWWWEFPSLVAYAEFVRVGDKDAEKLRRLLEIKYDRTPLDLKNGWDLVGAASWRALNGDAKGVLELLDALIVGGYPFRDIAFLPEFDFMRETPEFKERLKKLDAVAARCRGEIGKQLAKPDPGWVTP